MLISTIILCPVQTAIFQYAFWLDSAIQLSRVCIPEGLNICNAEGAVSVGQHNDRTFLSEHQIALPGLLVEVCLDESGAFMMLDACEIANLEWDLSRTDARDNNPGVLDIQLTDVVEDSNKEQEESCTCGEQKLSPWRALEQAQHHAEANHQPSPQLANVTPSGLFAFAMMVGLETTYLLESLVLGTVTDAFLLTWGPYSRTCSFLVAWYRY
jgi:hypothetical protein